MIILHILVSLVDYKISISLAFNYPIVLPYLIYVKQYHLEIFIISLVKLSLFKYLTYKKNCQILFIDAYIKYLGPANSHHASQALNLQTDNQAVKQTHSLTKLLIALIY